MRLFRSLVRALVLTLILVLGAGVAAVAVSQTAWFRNWLRGFIVSQSSQYLNGELRIGRLDGNLFYGIQLGDVTVTMDGQPVVSLHDVVLRYNAWQLLTSGLSIDELRISRPDITLRADESGWQIARLIKRQEQEADREGPQKPFAVQQIVVADGHVVIDAPGQSASIPKEMRSLGAVASFAYEPVHYSLKIESLSLQAKEPDLQLQQLGGGIAVRDDTLFLDDIAVKTGESSLAVAGDIRDYLSRPQINLHAVSPQLSLPEIARFVPALDGIALTPAIEAKVSGPLDAMKLDLFTRSDAGALKAVLNADFADPGQTLSGDVSVQHLDLAPLLKDPAQRSDITGDLKIDLAGTSFAEPATLHGTVTANARVVAAGYTADRLDLSLALAAGHAPRVQAKVFAYGAQATADGHVSLPAKDAPVRFDLRGRLGRLNLRSLPRRAGAPPATTNINASYHVTGSEPVNSRTTRRLTADLRFSTSTVPGARIDEGTTVQLDVTGRDIAYKTDASIAELDLQAIGRAFDVPALVDERYASNITAHVIAEGRGTDPKTLDVDATGTIPSADLMGGRVADVMFSTGLHQDNLRVEADGQFAGFDPARLSGKPELAGQVDGEFSAQTQVADLSTGVTLQTIEADARATLKRSTVGGLVIEQASLDAAVQHDQAIVRDLNIVGRDVNASASGTVALGDTGASDLVFHANSPALVELGALANVPLTGIARMDGTITGNRQALVIAGTLEGDGLRYEENGALALRSEFKAEVPDLTLAQAKVDATSRGTFVTVAGQNINELTAHTVYDNQRVAFEMTASQPQRQLDAAGDLTLHPEHREVHLNRLVLQAGNQQWQVPDGTSPTIQYGENALTVEGLRLVNGDQEIAAAGRIGVSGETLAVTARNVDLAAVDALLLRQPQFSGRANATAELSGPLDAPAVAAEFSVTPGGFKQFTYESLGGTANYDGNGITLDARLQQNAAQWITAKGYLPIAALRTASTGEVPASAQRPVSVDESIDLTIDSSPLGLGLIQGFTTSLRDVDGTVEAHVRVTGTANDPKPQGTVTIAKGMLTVVPTGVTYTNIAGKVELQPDRAHIDQITVLDNHQSALSITGDLAVSGRSLQGMHLWVNAEDFKIVDNQLGNVRIQTAMEIAGDLLSPMIQGDFSIDTGRVNLDEILAAVGPSAYSTRQTEYLSRPTSPTAVPDAQTEPAPSVFDALRMDLRIQVPNDLVIKASSLQAPGAPVSLGALNVTLGGDLTAHKSTRGPVRVNGRVNTVRGTYDFQGRRFDILRDGTVRFDGDVTQPVLDIRTRREIQGVEALVTVRGPIERPEIILASTPSLDEADILSLIVFNQPINQLGAGQQAALTSRAQSMALGAVTGQIAQEIGDVLNLDTFEINVGPDSGASAELTLGQQVGKDLYVKVQQGVGETTTTNVVIEYALASWLRLQTNFLQGSSAQQSMFRKHQGSGADLIVLFTK